MKFFKYYFASLFYGLAVITLIGVILYFTGYPNLGLLLEKVAIVFGVCFLIGTFLWIGYMIQDGDNY